MPAISIAITEIVSTCTGGGGGAPPAAAALDFSLAANSMYLPLF